MFPYGLYKVENLVSLISSLLIFLAGYEIVHTVLTKSRPLKIAYLPYAMVGVLLTMGISFVFSRYELRQGKRIGSPSLIADAQHIFTDVLSSAVILGSLLGGWFGFGAVDKIAAIIVVIFVFRAGIPIFLNALRVLLDASIDFNTLDQVKTIILKNPNVAAINGLWGRNSGRFKFIEADIRVKVKDLEKAQFVSQGIEESLKRSVFNVDHILIHYEPQKKETRVCAVPLMEDRNTISEHFGDASYFDLVTIKESERKILSESYLHNPFAGEAKGKGIKVSEWLLEKGVDTIYTQKESKGKGPGYVFSDATVDIILTEAKTLAQVKENLYI